jgi:membrane protease YdiL (CAAX protease family)
MELKDEEIIAVGLLIATSFIYINVSASIGTLYTLFSVFYLASIFARRKDWVVEIITKNTDLLKSLILSFASFIVWVCIASFMFVYVKPNMMSAIEFESLFSNIASYTQVPVISTDFMLKLIIYGILIPVIESLFFLSFVLKFWSRLLNVNIMWYNFRSPYFLKMLYVCALVGACGSLFHLAVRMSSDFALILDFLFFFISSLIVFRTKRLFEAINLHILNNSCVLLFGG